MNQKSCIFLICVLTLVHGCRTDDQLTPPREATLTSVSVIASVMGYETSRRLPNGQNVPTLKSNTNEVEDASGFVFWVLYPGQYRGRIFRLHHDGKIASGDPTRLYEVDKVYELQVYPTDLIREAGCSLRPLGREVNAAELAEAELEMQKQKLVYQINDLKARRKFKQTKSSASILKNREHLEKNIQELEKKLMELDERIKKEKGTIPQPGDPSNPHSPSAQGAGGR